MRIVLSNASAKWGGVHLITELLAEGLEQRGHDVLVLCRPGSLLEDRLRGRIGYAPVARGMDLSPLAIARIAGALRRFRPAVVLALMDKDLRLTALAARLLRIPLVARRANDQPIDRGPYETFIYGSLVAHHVANSEATKATLLGSAPWLSGRDVTVIYNGIDVAGIAAARPAFVPLPRNAVVACFVGRLETRKGVHDLLEAWPIVARQNATVQLIVAGRGDLDDEVEDRARSLERVTFLGYREDVAGVLQRCDLVVVPSHWEGFGLVAAEALAAGKPVVASRVSSLPEIVRDGEEGLLIPPRDPPALAAAILRLAADPQLRARLGAAGRARVQDRFTHERMVAEYETLLARVAEKTAP